MKKHEFGFKHWSVEDKRFYIYANCKESLLKAIADGYTVEQDTDEISSYGHHKIWIPNDGKVIEHYTLYRIIPKEEQNE